MLPSTPPLTSAAAARWSALAVPGWVTKGALTAGWVLAFVAATAGAWENAACTPGNPTVCGPDQTFALWFVICLATPVLLLWMPLPGCAAGMAFALADLTYDDVTSARIAFGLHGLACAVTAVWLLRAAAAQERVAAAATCGARAALPSSEAFPDSAPPDTHPNVPRLVLAAVLVLLGGSAMGWYVHETRAERAHLLAAEQVTGRVVAVDDESFTITLDAAARAGSRSVTTGVLDPEPYPTGSTAQVLLDPTDPSWSRLVAEPQDATGWESLGLFALLLAALLALRERYARRAVRRLLTGQHPALRVWVAPDESGLLVFPDDDARPDLTRARAVARLPLTWQQAAQFDNEDEARWDQEKWDDEKWDDDLDGRTSPDEETASFGRLWRGEEDPEASESHRFEPISAEPALLLGSLHDRGWALLVSEKGRPVSSGPLRVGNLRALDGPRLWDRLLAMLPFGDWPDGGGMDAPGGPAANPGEDPAKHSAQGPGADQAEDTWLPGVPIRTRGQDDLDLPLEARVPMRTRSMGRVMMVVGLIGAPAALLLLDPSWWEGSIIIILGGRLLLGGVGRALQHVRLTQNNLEITGSYRVHLVPWERVHGARLDGARLHVAWEPELISEVGPFEPGRDSQAARAQQLGSAMLQLREHALLGGTPIMSARSRLGPAWGLAVAYVALVFLALWVVAT